MTADRHFDDVLAELSPYLDDPPLLDSPERLRLDQLIAEVARLAARGEERRAMEEIGRLDAEIERLVRRARDAGSVRIEARGQATSS